ncbi:hypothetical protein J2129_002159 [Methanofollis sp. W23]|uniref:hypothetical protein n=1 Tax=Methanofollis sp. W23 TaxID=2817849 RepID=UPI001AE88088|nr:hypothetical protein [Methanofollis sp. W23]MBP2146705.1 hypothetical protein [Methanofollis sp. W23]
MIDMPSPLFTPEALPHVPHDEDKAEKAEGLIVLRAIFSPHSSYEGDLCVRILIHNSRIESQDHVHGKPSG